MNLSPSTRRKLKATLSEDIGKGDKTSRLLIPANANGRAVIIARERGVLCGEAVVREIFRLASRNLTAHFFVKDGGKFSRNQKVVEVKGNVRAILKAERTVLNFLGHLSGIATLTRQFVNRVKGFKVAILDTRKTTPLWRELEKEAVRVGGGRNHRFGLFDALFVKENHRPFGDLKKLHGVPKQFEIEVRNYKELAEALALRPRTILFDNFKPGPLKKAVALVRKLNTEILLEASGGMTLKNVGAYAATGVDQISIGALTHSVKSVDFSLLLLPH